MAAHAPYIMPDGRHLAAVLKQDRESSSSSQKKGKQRRGKDELWAQLQRSAGGAGLSTQEAAELHALEQVGHRRRRRWLNDKLLRDMAGAMTALDMEAQFKPVPFGVEAPPSVFMQAMQAESGVWEHFRNVDLDKEERVLTKWAEHNKALHSAGGDEAVHPTAAAAALQSWASVGKTARAALKKANIHSVLELESQIMDHFAPAATGVLDVCEELLLNLPDSFGRLLVHGLAEFHGLLSASRTLGLEKYVAVYRRPLLASTSSPAAAAAAPSVPRRAGVAEEHLVTCTDVLNALHELGSCDQRRLEAYVRMHVHGSEDMAFEREYVVV